MELWHPGPPRPSRLGDHDVPLLGQHLLGQRLALLVCGGIAAMRAPMIARALRRQGATVIAYLSPEALRYVTVDTMAWSTNQAVVTQLTPQSEHLSDAAPFAGYVLAPATYNTINKFRFGIADNCVTAVLATALGRLERKQAGIWIAPTMHGNMYNSVLHESLLALQSKGVSLIPPRDDYGKLNIPDEQVIVAHVCAGLSKSPLRGQRILVTAGPTPAPIDEVRCITNRFQGRLGIEIAKDLTLRGAEVELILGAGSVEPPDYLKTLWAADFENYRDLVRRRIEEFQPSIGIFSAAVADFSPKKRFSGKIPSGGHFNSIELQRTEKVIDLVRRQAPDLKMVSFKFQLNMELSRLLKIAKDRVKSGHLAVIANRGEERGPQGEQIAYLVAAKGGPRKFSSKPGIALGLSQWLEEFLLQDSKKVSRPKPVKSKKNLNGTSQRMGPRRKADLEV